jgi:hypothetical protein
MPPHAFAAVLRQIRFVLMRKPVWHTSPDDMCTILNEQATTNGFVPNVDDFALDGCQRIAATVVQRKLAVPAVIFGSAHWVVVSAVLLDQDPAQQPPGSPYSIKGFFIDNPMPITSDGHAHREDDVCGHGGLNGSKKTFVTLEAWLSLYWDEPCADFGDRPGFVTVSPGAGVVLPAPQPRVTARAPSKLPSAPIDARAVAEAGFRKCGLDRLGPLVPFLQNVQFGVARPMNDDDDDGDPTYFIVQLLRDGALAGNALVGGLDGLFQGVQAPASTSVPLHEPPSIVDDILAGNVSRLAAFVAGSKLADELGAPENVTIGKKLIWKRSAESMSPFRGLISVDVSGARWFVGLDGSVSRGVQSFHA